MKSYVKIALTAMLIASFFLLSGFRSQTIIHDDGSETQDVLKVSDTDEGQKTLKGDADDFQKRSFTIMDYSNENGTGFRAMKTVTKDGANKSSVDHIIHKTHDGLICSTYYIDYNYDSDSLKNLRLGAEMPEDGSDLEYVVSFPAGTRVVSNSDKADDQGSTYMWQLSSSNPREMTLQATVWHKLFIYIALFFVVLILIIVLILEHRRKNVISWKKAAHMRKVEMMLLLIPLVILGYMGYEYYIGTHVTSASLDKVAQQQQEELMETREEDRRLQNDTDHKQREGEKAAARIRDKAGDITKEIRTLEEQYNKGTIDRSSARSQAQNLAQQAEDMLNDESGLSQADREVLEQLIDSVVSEAESVGLSPQPVREESSSSSSSRQRSRDESEDTSETESRSSRDESSDDSSSGRSSSKDRQSDNTSSDRQNRASSGETNK